MIYSSGKRATAVAVPGEVPVSFRERNRRFFLATGTLWQREMVRFFRQPARVIGAFGSPLVFWLLIGSGLGTSFGGRGAEEGVHYLTYFFPGTLVLILLFSSIFSTISVIEDRKEGFLQSVLSAPVSRGAIVLGKLLGGAVPALLQALLFCALAPLADFKFDSVLVSLELGAALTITALALTGLGLMIAWPMESSQGFHAVMNLFFVPMWLLSGALFPPDGAAEWVRSLMTYNPLSYPVALVRQILSGESGVAHAQITRSLAWTVTLAFAGITFLGSCLVVKRRSRT